MSMCASPISASEIAADPFNDLWRLSRLAGTEYLDCSSTASAQHRGLQGAVLDAVSEHLRARSLFARKRYLPAHQAVLGALAAWHRVEKEIEAADPELARRAHA